VSSRQPAVDVALEELIRRYSRVIRSAVSRVSGELASGEADDIQQKVLISLWKATGGEQMPSHPSSYLYRAAVRETVRTVKARRAVIQIELDDRRQDPRPSPERRAESRELGKMIRNAIATLSPDRRRAVQAHLMGYDVQEIMTMMDWPYNKARNLIARGMADLRQELVQRGIHG
jgi:RNA polymerase sigma factor (sigma-70 family)